MILTTVCQRHHHIYFCNFFVVVSLRLCRPPRACSDTSCRPSAPCLLHGFGGAVLCCYYLPPPGIQPEMVSFIVVVAYRTATVLFLMNEIRGTENE